VLAGQLATGSGDIVSSFGSLGHIHSGLLENSSESSNSVAVRASESVSGIDPVERNQVDHIWHAFEERDEGLCLVRSVSHVFDEKVFEGHLSACGGLIISHGAHDFSDGPFLIDGHQPISHFVERGVKGKGQVDWESLFGQLFDLRNEADG